MLRSFFFIIHHIIGTRLKVKDRVLEEALGSDPFINLWPRGWRGIRTPGIPINTSVFKTDSFNRSDIHPLRPPLRLFIRNKWLIYAIRYALLAPIGGLYCPPVSETFPVVRIATLHFLLYDNMHLGCCAPRGSKIAREWRTNDLPNKKSDWVASSTLVLSMFSSPCPCWYCWWPINYEML